MTSKIVKFVGSIRLAVPLLAAIAIILIGATFYESQVGSATVQRLIYKSPWFGALMFLLAVNLGISTLSRYPWRGARKIGFALAHWGLIVIIAGSAAVIHLSTEGMLLVRTDGGPANQIRVEGDWLEVVNPDQSAQQTDIFVRGDGSVYPNQVGDIALLGYSENAIKTVQFTNTGQVENTAVQVQLHSDRMGQTVQRWLAIAPAGYRQIDIGPAHLEIFPAADQTELEELLTPPAPESAAAGRLQLGDRQFDVQASLNQVIRLPGGMTAEITQVWPDFRLGANNQPTSASDEYRNPAIQVNFTQGDAQASWYVFANPDFQPIQTGVELAGIEQLGAIAYTAPQSQRSSYFRIVVAPDGQLHYAALSSKGFKSGIWVAGETVAPGWVDFELSLVQILDHAQVQRQVVPVTPVAAGTLGNSDFPALHLAIAGQDTWLPWGEPTSVETEQGTFFAAFSPKLLQLPFYVKLNDFIVERNEGSESVAMWTSDVTLFDAQTDTAVQRSVWMNHPTWFRGWKLAQASWNPGDLQQSTLQLKREPWWVTALTWAGSLMVTLGITTMFYGPGVVKKYRRWRKGGGAELAVADQADAADQTVAPRDLDADLETEAAGDRPTIPILAIFGK